MKAIKFAAGVAVSVLVSFSAHAAGEQRFSALEGVDAQALSAPEMGDVYGQLTIQDIKDAVAAKVANPKAVAAVDRAIDRLVEAHPVVVNKVLAVLTRRGF